MTLPPGYRTADDIRDRVCGSKIRHRNQAEARAHQQHLADEAPAGTFGIYPCPFSDDRRHWHAGHVPSLEALQAIARVMRGLPPTEPVPHDPPAKNRRTRKARRR